MKMITRNTMRADGLTVGEAMDRDAQFLIGLGIPAILGALTFDEIKEQRREKIREAVLAAIDESLGGKGWVDQDLPELFKALDKVVEGWENRNFNASIQQPTKITP